MRSLISLFLFASACTAAAAEPQPEARGLTCGVSGHNVGNKGYWWSVKKDTATLSKCADHCKKDKHCKSYTFGEKEGKCLHYSCTASKNVRKDAKSPYKFYDRDCILPKPTPTHGYGYGYPVMTPTTKKTSSAKLTSTKKSSTSSTKVTSTAKPSSKSTSTKPSSSTKQSSVSAKPTTSSKSGYSTKSSSTSMAASSSSSSSSSKSSAISSSGLPTSTASTEISSSSTSASSTSSALPSASACPGVKGYSTTATTTDPDLTLPECMAKCSSKGTSKSFGFGKPCANCVAICSCHDEKVAAHVHVSSSAMMTFYDLDCSEAPAESSTSFAQESITSSDAGEPTGSASLSSSDAEVPTSTSSEASTSVNNDSPPYTPSGEVVMPTDPEEFLATYTFQDDPLPTPVVMGTPPIATGVGPAELDPVKTCIVEPNQADATFQLLDSEDRIPLVKRADGTLSTPIAPKSEAEYKAMPPIEDMKFGSFSFAAGQGELFDLVINDSPRQYIARRSDGSVVLTDSSKNDDELKTSIFEVTCQGRITVRIGPQYYTWTVSEKGTVMEAGEGTPETMYTLPDRPAAQLRRRTKAQEGVAPRCNSSPRPLEARVFPGARPNNPNQCGSDSFNVPDLSFGSCCDRHDNDYDNCGLTFEEGNNNFRSCMRGEGCRYLDHWYSWPAYLGCLSTAEFYYSVVSGYFGKQAFYEANTDRCKCYCTSPSPHMCNVNGQLQCLNLLGNDVNNCGACGQKCPDGARCEGGQCKCPVDQCGDRCVTLASHPRNCGQCGRVSPSGYCVQGQFYTPPAFCSKGNGFRNGNFANGQNDWTAQIISGGGNSRFNVGGDGGAEDVDRMVGIFSLYAPNGGANLRTQVKMCPGIRYSLRFQIRRPYGTDYCSYTVFVAGEQRYQGLVPQPTNVGAGWQWMNPLLVGPFNGPRNGVTATGPELWADFELQIRCSGSAPYNFIRVDQFSLTPL